MSKINRVKYFTDERKSKINPKNKELYEKYLKSNVLKNKDVKNTTYYVYENYMTHFLVYLAENWDNVGLYDEDFFENAIDIIEGYMGFCQDILKNNKKVINTKIATISSFYLWSLKRRLVPRHPFDKQVDRMKYANDEKIISSYFLDDSQIESINKGLLDETEYDIQDRLIWNIMLDSCNRVGAIHKLTLSSLDLENRMFKDIREKRGYRVEVVFSEYTKKLIEEWLEIRKEMDNLTIDSIFITKYQHEYKIMCKNTIQNRIKRIGEIINIQDFRSHCIRKTSLNHIYEKTNNIDLAAAMGNHKSIETTRSSYIKPKSKAEVFDKIKKILDEKE